MRNPFRVNLRKIMFDKHAALSYKGVINNGDAHDAHRSTNPNHRPLLGNHRNVHWGELTAMTRKHYEPQTVRTIVQNWLGLSRFETDQVLAQMDDYNPDYDTMDVAQIRALAEEAMECLIQERTLGRAALFQP